MAIFIISGFVLAQWLVNLHRETELMLAQRWFERGDRAMQTGYPAIAAEDYRTALTYKRDDYRTRLRLAEALLAANRYDEARAHLISLLEEDPADGEVNLALARLYVKRGLRSEAIRYYRNAINGVWNESPREQRIATRFELVQYLLQSGDVKQAEVELIALQADGPQDVDQQLKLAQMLLQIGEPARAQGVYDAVLKVDANNAQALLGDGKASFEMGDYREAERELVEALEHDKSLTEAQQLLQLVREILRISPGLRGLSVTERAQRAARAFDVAMARLNSCAAQRGYSLAVPGAPAAGNSAGSTAGQSGAPASALSKTGTTAAPNNLQLLYSEALQKKSQATESSLRKNPDLIEPTMDFVFEVERSTQPVCGDMSEADRALVVLANHQSEAVQ